MTHSHATMASRPSTAPSQPSLRVLLRPSAIARPHAPRSGPHARRSRVPTCLAAMPSRSALSQRASPLARSICRRRGVCHPRAASTNPSGSEMVVVPPNGRVVLLGITGVTGRSALQGLLSVMGPGRTAHQLVAVSRSPGGVAARSLPGGVQVLGGDLDDPASLAAVLAGADAVYCHALSKDASTADPTELVRAQNLATAAKAAGVKLILYNSSGGKGCGYGITQMEQKHRVEDILAAAVPTVGLQATMFMEELWKRYTRPGILKGTFTWSTPSDRPVQLVAARDMGLAAGTLMTAPGGVAVPTDPRVGRALRLRAIELAGDELTPQQMADVFAKVQGSPVRHNRAPAWPFWFLARDVFRISRFLTERGFGADTAACRKQFPGMLTFEDFLRATGWADLSRTYEDGIAFVGAGGASGEGATKAAASTPLRN